MSWSESAAGDGRNDNQTTEGWHVYEVIKCIRAKKDGTELRSPAGPFLLVVVKDEAGGEGTCRYWLTDKVQWKIARDLSRLGIAMDEYDERGVTIQSFMDAAFASEELNGRTSPGYATPSGQYMDIELCSPDKVPAAQRGRLGMDPGEVVPVEDRPPFEDEGGGDDGDDSESLPF